MQTERSNVRGRIPRLSNHKLGFRRGELGAVFSCPRSDFVKSVFEKVLSEEKLDTFCDIITGYQEKWDTKYFSDLRGGGVLNLYRYCSIIEQTL